MTDVGSFFFFFFFFTPDLVAVDWIWIWTENCCISRQSRIDVEMLFQGAYNYHFSCPWNLYTKITQFTIISWYIYKKKKYFKTIHIWEIIYTSKKCKNLYIKQFINNKLYIKQLIHKKKCTKLGLLGPLFACHTSMIYGITTLAHYSLTWFISLLV